MIRFIKLRLKSKGLINIIGAFAHYFLHLKSFGLDRLSAIGRTEYPALFKQVVIQTQTECNYNCSFCPNKKIDRPHGVMTDNIFNKIIDELSTIGFDGIIYPNMQEPMLDPEIVLKCWDISHKCPKATIILETNGSLLREKGVTSLLYIPNLYLIVNDYTEDSKIINKINDFVFINHHKRLVLTKRSSTQVLTNRAGNIGKPVHLSNFCERPFNQIIVAYNGDVILCAADWKHEEVMGSIVNNSLRDVWYGKRFTDLRKNLLKFNRIGLCSKCDYWGIE